MSKQGAKSKTNLSQGEQSKPSAVENQHKILLAWRAGATNIKALHIFKYKSNGNLLRPTPTSLTANKENQPMLAMALLPWGQMADKNFMLLAKQVPQFSAAKTINNTWAPTGVSQMNYKNGGKFGF